MLDIFSQGKTGDDLLKLFLERKESKIIKELAKKTNKGDSHNEAYNDGVNYEDQGIDLVSLSIKLHLKNVFDYIVDKDPSGFQVWSNKYICESLISNDNYFFNKISEKKFYHQDESAEFALIKEIDKRGLNNKFETLCQKGIVSKNYQTILNNNNNNKKYSSFLKYL